MFIRYKYITYKLNCTYKYIAFTYNYDAYTLQKQVSVDKTIKVKQSMGSLYLNVDKTKHNVIKFFWN